MTSGSGAATGNLRSRIWSISVKMAVLAPMPRASDRIATAANSGLRRSPRIARRKSDNELVILVLGRIESRLGCPLPYQATPMLIDSAQTPVPRGNRIVLLASLGGALEFYDFVIFGVFAKDIADAIFPNPTPLISLMVSFAAFAAGYLARPIGGIVLSHFGDRFGRRRVFLVSIFVMSGATFGLGLVPSFAVWGPPASVLMVVLRLVQGFCLGGELPGALTYAVETAPRQAPFVCSVVFSCVTLGVAAAAGLSLALRTWLPAPLVAAWGWRVAFVLGGLGGLLSFVLRRSLEESPEFVRMKALASRHPFREVLRSHLGRVAVGVSGLAATAGFNGLFFAHI